MKPERRIGILTHHYINNYGAFLQAYALQETLASLAPSAKVEIINYINMKHYLYNLRPFLLSRPRSKNLVEATKVFFQDKKQLCQFYKARKRLNISPRFWNAHGINQRGYDVIVIGSDEVWSLDSVSFDSVKFGTGLTCANIVSYAPSVGGLTPDQPLPGFIPRSMRKFRKISARDDLTRIMVSRFYSGDIEMVLDPAFLLDFDSIGTSGRLPDYEYLLVYQCVLDARQVRLLKEFANANGLLILGAGCYEDWFDRSMIDLSPFEWAGLFSRARYVVTGTFHGVIFAIKAKKRFVAFPTMVNRTSKIISLLGLLGLEDRLIGDTAGDDICDRLACEIDYGSVGRTIDVLKHRSMAFLRENVVESIVSAASPKHE